MNVSCARCDGGDPDCPLCGRIEEVLKEIKVKSKKKSKRKVNKTIKGWETDPDEDDVSQPTWAKSMNGDDVMSVSNTYQPKPKKNQLKPIWELVIEDMKKRDEFGRKKHKTPLQPFNGRSALIDAYQEALDLVVYLRQAIEEKNINDKCYAIVDLNEPFTDELIKDLEKYYRVKIIRKKRDGKHNKVSKSKCKTEHPMACRCSKCEKPLNNNDGFFE